MTSRKYGCSLDVLCWIGLVGTAACASQEALEDRVALGGVAGFPTVSTGTGGGVSGAGGGTLVARPTSGGMAGVPAEEPGTGGVGGSVAVDPAMDALPGPSCVRGGTPPVQIAMIGDSFYHITQIPQELWANARAAGALGASDTYPSYYLSGAMMSAPGIATPITEQYDQARAAQSNITDIVMNGGGNDVLIRDRSCLTMAPPANAQCAQTIDGVVNDARALFVRMGADGVQRVVFAFYPHMPTFGVFQGYAPAINDTIDYAQEKARAVCEASLSPRCFFVSTREAFEGHPEYLNPGDVHASPAGSVVAADLIWQSMVDNCVAQ